MPKWTPILIALIVLLAGCSVYQGSLKTLPALPPNTSATLVVIAEKSIFSHSMAFVTAIDGVDVYSIARNQYAILPIAPGEHVITGKSQNVRVTDESVVKINPKAGETVYLYFVFHKLESYISLTRVTEWEAKELMEKAERVGS